MSKQNKHAVWYVSKFTFEYPVPLPTPFHHRQPSSYTLESLVVGKRYQINLVGRNSPGSGEEVIEDSSEIHQNNNEKNKRGQYQQNTS